MLLLSLLLLSLVFAIAGRMIVIEHQEESKVFFGFENEKPYKEVVVKVHDELHPNEYSLMTPDDTKFEYIVEKVTKDKCSYIIQNHNDYPELKDKQCMVFVKYWRNLFSIIFIKNTEKDYYNDTSVLFGKWVMQLLYTLTFLDHHNIMHNDIKPENILITNAYLCDVRVGDFGFAKKSGSDYRFYGTLRYLSPERAKTLLYKSQREVIKNKTLWYTRKSDVYALGVVVYALCYRDYPIRKDFPDSFLSGTDTENTLYNILHADIEQIINSKGECHMEVDDRQLDVKPLMKDMLRKDPDLRLSAEGALKKHFQKVFVEGKFKPFVK
eukprot:GHVR01009511.1.p1 GENE.GHVR01009511.1~~GHVR01009511.1.p1  ORF type:complete len:325 (-),score=53.63 GHVR01009511.1:53-1027(-)